MERRASPKLREVKSYLTFKHWFRRVHKEDGNDLGSRQFAVIRNKRCESSEPDTDNNDSGRCGGQTLRSTKPCAVTKLVPRSDLHLPKRRTVAPETRSLVDAYDVDDQCENSEEDWVDEDEYEEQDVSFDNAARCSFDGEASTTTRIATHTASRDHGDDAMSNGRRPIGAGSLPESNATQLAEDWCASSLSQRTDILPADLDLRGLSTLEEVLNAAHPNCHREHRVAMQRYLYDYSEGKYNIISPPEPPVMRRSFSFLPAFVPSNEPSRLAALSTWGRPWSTKQLTSGAILIAAARQEFSAAGAAISYINSDQEELKVSNTYKRRSISRPESIGAHVVFSTEVLAVLDTQKDWRFAGNPIVLEPPYIRFYAGAPLLSPDGEVIGVFAIFDSEPRDMFSVSERRILADYALKAMRIITESPYSARQRSTDAQALSGASAAVDSSPLGNNESTGGACPSPCERLFLSEEVAQTLLQPLGHSFNRNYKKLTLLAKPSPSRGSNHNSASLGNMPSRPFSGSDLTSVDNNLHLNTPADCCFAHMGSRDLRDERNHRLLPSDSHHAECQRRHRRKILTFGFVGLSRMVESGRSKAPVGPARLHEEQGVTQSGAGIPGFSRPSSGYAMTISSSGTTHSAVREFPASHSDDSGAANMLPAMTSWLGSRALALAEHAVQSVGIDAMYVLRFPASSPLSLEEAAVKQDARIRTLMLYQRVPSLPISISLGVHHLVAKSNIGCMHWRSCDGDEVYSKAFFMRLWPDVTDIADTRTGVSTQSLMIVLGAMRLTSTDSNLCSSFSTGELKKLIHIGEQMREVVQHSLEPSGRENLRPTEPSVSESEVVECGGDYEEVDSCTSRCTCAQGSWGRTAMLDNFKTVEELERDWIGHSNP